MLDKYVKEAYINAYENGYDLDSMSAEDVAYDMIEFDSNLENYEFLDVCLAVYKYRNNGSAVELESDAGL